MRKTFILLMTAISISLSAQKKDDLYSFSKEKVKQAYVIDNKSYISVAGSMFEKSAKYQMAAIGCGAVSAGMAILGGITANKEMPDETKDAVKWQKDNKNKSNTFFYIGGASALAAIALEFVAIDYKLRGGKILRISGGNNNVGIALNF